MRSIRDAVFGQRFDKSEQDEFVGTKAGSNQSWSDVDVPSEYKKLRKGTNAVSVAAHKGDAGAFVALCVDKYFKRLIVEEEAVFNKDFWDSEQDSVLAAPNLFFANLDSIMRSREPDNRMEEMNCFYANYKNKSLVAYWINKVNYQMNAKRTRSDMYRDKDLENTWKKCDDELSLAVMFCVAENTLGSPDFIRFRAVMPVFQEIIHESADHFEARMRNMLLSEQLKDRFTQTMHPWSDLDYKYYAANRLYNVHCGTNSFYRHRISYDFKSGGAIQKWQMLLDMGLFFLAARALIEELQYSLYQNQYQTSDVSEGRGIYADFMETSERVRPGDFVVDFAGIQLRPMAETPVLVNEFRLAVSIIAQSCVGHLQSDYSGIYNQAALDLLRNGVRGYGVVVGNTDSKHTQRVEWMNITNCLRFFNKTLRFGGVVDDYMTEDQHNWRDLEIQCVQYILGK